MKKLRFKVIALKIINKALSIVIIILIVYENEIESFPDGAYQVVVTIADRRVAELRTIVATVAISPDVPVVCQPSYSSQSGLTPARLRFSVCTLDFGKHVAPACMDIIAFSYIFFLPLI